MAKIKSIQASEILDSRGYPTIQATVILTDDTFYRSSVPTGTYVSDTESTVLIDGDMSRFEGRGVSKSVQLINDTILRKLITFDPTDQKKIDNTLLELDGTPMKSKIGGNTMLAVSQAVARAGASLMKMPLSVYLRTYTHLPFENIRLPVPIFNIIEGGRHATSGLSFLQFLLIPASSKNFRQSLELGATIYHTLKKQLDEKGLSTLVADEGGFSPEMTSSKDVLSLLRLAVESSNFKYALDVFLGIDAASSSFYERKSYQLADRPNSYSGNELYDMYKGMINDFSMLYIEDPFAPADREEWQKLYKDFGEHIMIVGDDLTTTNLYQLQYALTNNIINTVMIKPSQIGTVTETIAFCEVARYKKLKLIMSHRSGETGDSFVADFAVGVGADFVKFGAPARERIVKYNRMLDIEEEMEMYHNNQDKGPIGGGVVPL